MIISAPTGRVSIDYLEISMYNSINFAAGRNWGSLWDAQIVHPGSTHLSIEMVSISLYTAEAALKNLWGCMDFTPDKLLLVS